LGPHPILEALISQDPPDGFLLGDRDILHYIFFGPFEHQHVLHQPVVGRQEHQQLISPK